MPAHTLPIPRVSLSAVVNNCPLLYAFVRGCTGFRRNLSDNQEDRRKVALEVLAEVADRWRAVPVAAE